MSLFLLDTNICIYVINRRPIQVLQKFEQYASNLAISSITLAELRFGAANSVKPEHNHQQISQFCQYLDVMHFDDFAAFSYSEIRSFLKKQGNLIGDNDLLIAAHAVSLEATLVSNNIREFERVPQLQLENWL